MEVKLLGNQLGSAPKVLCTTKIELTDFVEKSQVKRVLKMGKDSEFTIYMEFTISKHKLWRTELLRSGSRG